MTPISLLRTQTYDRAVLHESLSALLAPLGGMAAIVKPGDRVLLKPNLLTGARPTKECTTRPELVAVVAEWVRPLLLVCWQVVQMCWWVRA